MRIGVRRYEKKLKGKNKKEKKSNTGGMWRIKM
jgi:hypothetical protein